MTTKLRFPILLSLFTLAAGAAGCSNGSSPTEPASFDTPVTASSSSLAVSGDKRHGADDPAGDDRGGRAGGRQGRGNDDPAGDDRGGRGRGRGGNGGNNNGGNNNGGNNGNNGGNQQRPPRTGTEREGTVASVDAGALVLAGGQRIVVNGQTQWDSRGDLFSLQQVAAAVNTGKPTRAEARGTLRADGALVAQTVKAEVDQ
jgi:ribonuclease J